MLSRTTAVEAHLGVLHSHGRICCLDRAVCCRRQPLLVVPLQLCSLGLRHKTAWMRRDVHCAQQATFAKNARPASE